VDAIDDIFADRADSFDGFLGAEVVDADDEKDAVSLDISRSLTFAVQGPIRGRWMRSFDGFLGLDISRSLTFAVQGPIRGRWMR